MANLKRRLETAEAAAVAAGGGHSVEMEPAWIAALNRGFALYKNENRTETEQVEMSQIERELGITMQAVDEACKQYI